MKTAAKGRVLNLLVIIISAITLAFSLGASWVIMHESMSILNTMPLNTNTIIVSAVGMGLTLLWLNNLLIDSVAWTAAKYWNKGIKNG